MKQFFNPNVAFDPANQQQWDNDTIRQQLAQRQALAKVLMSMPREGQMVSGWYAGPSKGQSFAAAIASGLGGYVMGKQMGAETDLMKGNREAQRYARELMQPSQSMDEMVAAAEAANPMAVYTHKRPEEVGPQLPAPATTSPVTSNNVTMLPMARLAADPAARAGTEQSGAATVTTPAPTSGAGALMNNRRLTAQTPGAQGLVTTPGVVAPAPTAPSVPTAAPAAPAAPAADHRPPAPARGARPRRDEEGRRVATSRKRAR
jgi:hypothetical protein